MEKQQQGLPTELNSIGANKYRFLKGLPESDLTDQEKADIENYESRHNPTPEQESKKAEYIRSLFIERPTIDSVVTKGWLWRRFLENFKLMNGVEFIQNQNTIQNVKSIMLYFLKHVDFFECQNLSSLSKPSFDKGLMIIGTFGCGKSAIMQAMQKTLFGLRGYHFRYYNTNQVIKIFESINHDSVDIEFNRKSFDNSMNTGAICFDDLKTERIASNYGKVNLFREILEIRSQTDFKTYVTMNYKSGHVGNVAAAIDEIEEKYGERVYDRVYEMFNIIEFTGETFRL